VPIGTPSLRFALVWHDPPASELANPALVNNLDLDLIAPDETIHYPWTLDPESPSQLATTGVDTLNNVEHLEVDLPIAGTWRVRISGTNVPEGPQVATLVGLDLKAPGPPIGFTAADTSDSSISLSWTNAPDVDRDGTLIARIKQGNPPWSGPEAGSSYIIGQEIGPESYIVYIGDDDHSIDPYEDTAAEWGIGYEYLAYTFDDMHNYSIAASDSSTTGSASAVGEADRLEPSLTLGLPYPNPARSRVAFSFSLPSDRYALVRIYDTAGRLVRTLIDAPMSAGPYTASWDGRNDVGRHVAPGIYFYELRVGGRKLSHQFSWTR
jgi:hypothetical protein